MKDCVFCKIANGEIGCKEAYRDAEILAFEDLKPQAPVHILVIPRKHIARVSDANEKDAGLIAKMFLTAKNLAREKNIESSGYRMVINCNEDAGQVVFHLHLHLLGGRRFSWPPG